MPTPHLPVELWTQIFEHFQLTSRDIPWHDVKLKLEEDFIKLHMLRNICLVSKSFHRIAWPILYRVFPFTSGSLEYGKHATNDGDSRDELYLQTLHRNPAYADALRFIYLDLSRPDDEYCIYDESALATQVRTSHVDGSRYVLQPGSRLKRIQGVEAKQGLYEYFLAVVLLMCRNVQGLHLISPICEYPVSSRLDHALSLATLELPGVCAGPSASTTRQCQIFQNLRKMTVRFEGQCLCAAVSFPCRNHSWLFRILQSGSLETLTLRGMFWYSLENHDNVFFVPTRPLIAIHLMHLTTLRLLEYVAGGALTGNIVGSCPSLTVLEVVWGSQILSGDYSIETEELIAFDLIAAVIANHAPNLSTLVLDDSKLTYFRSSALPQHTFGRQLCDIEHLRTIRASESAFYTDERDECILEALLKIRVFEHHRGRQLVCQMGSSTGLSRWSGAQRETGR